MKIKEQAFVFTLILASLICLVSGAHAHDLWITMDDYRLEKKTGAGFKVFSSHHFPAPKKDLLAEDRLDKVLYFTPGAGQVPGKNGVKFSEQGTYVAAALPVNGFATKTPDGYQRGKNKKDVDHPILCSHSKKFAKAVFSVGGPGGTAYAAPLGHAMEILPLKDPAGLKKGDILPVRVLMEGKPGRTYVFGTYTGFSEMANTFAYTTRTDKKGVARIKIIHDGAWLLIAKHEDAYPDAMECDKQRWAASLTFEVK